MSVSSLIIIKKKTIIVNSNVSEVVCGLRCEFSSQISRVAPPSPPPPPPQSRQSRAWPGAQPANNAMNVLQTFQTIHRLAMVRCLSLTGPEYICVNVNRGLTQNMKCIFVTKW